MLENLSFAYRLPVVTWNDVQHQIREKSKLPRCTHQNTIFKKSQTANTERVWRKKETHAEGGMYTVAETMENTVQFSSVTQ